MQCLTSPPTPPWPQLARLTSLDLLVHYLASSTLWQELGKLSALASLQVEVVRAAPGVEFVLPEALRPLAAATALTHLQLRGFCRASDR